MIQTWENGRKCNFGPDLGILARFDPNLALIFFVALTSTMCYTWLQAIIVCNFKKTNEPNLRKWQKT